MFQPPDTPQTESDIVNGRQLIRVARGALTLLSCFGVLAPCLCADDAPGQITIQTEADRRVSLGVYDAQSGSPVRTLLQGDSFPDGTQVVNWDGLDNRGQPVPPGDYEWRSVSTSGFTPRYVTTIGINPPGGEHPEPRYSWVGNHVGAGIVDVDESGVIIGSPLTEGMMMLVKADREMTQTLWRRPQFYEGGQLRRAAISGPYVFMLHPNGKLRRLSSENGNVEAVWQVNWEDAVPSDMDARGRNLVAVYPDRHAVRWLSVDDGRALADVSLEGARAVAVIGEGEQEEAFVAAGTDVFRVSAGQVPERVLTLGGEVTAMDVDSTRRELWVVVDGHQVVRVDVADGFAISQTYSDAPRELGPYDPARFAGVHDIAADLNGGFFIAEPSRAPRRLTHIARDGTVIDEWFGGMSFYVNGTFDPDDPSLLYGIAPEGSVNVYRIDYDTGEWQIEACYETGRIGDSLFPHAGSFRAIRRDGELYLYHRVVPAVIRLDPEQRRAIPVAIAGRVINQGRTFFQFAGTGRDGYPQPWVAAAEHHGYNDLASAPQLYSWADADGDGEFDPAEFHFYSDAPRGTSFHNPGDFTSQGDYIGSTGINESHALIRLPVVAWEGPEQAAPRWDWSQVETAGEIIADSYGYGSLRGVHVGDDDAVTLAYQAGIMIREHGQYEGGGWPEAAMRGSRVLGFSSELSPIFAVGRQSKDAGEANTGVLYYPMQTTTGPHRSVVVNDQTKQPAQVWTHDGLYVGGLLDHREDDGLPDGFYRLHGDDNQGASLVTTGDGRTFWLMPYVGHNRLYEITGWDDWDHQSGRVARPEEVAAPEREGSGLTAQYTQRTTLVLEAIEAPIYHDPFGAEPHAGMIAPPYDVVWSGSVEVPLSDRFQFYSLLGADERVKVSIDGQLVHSAGGEDSVSESVDLEVGRRYEIRIDYTNPEGRAELKLLWSSRVVDPMRLPSELLYPGDVQ